MLVAPDLDRRVRSKAKPRIRRTPRGFQIMGVDPKGQVRFANTLFREHAGGQRNLAPAVGAAPILSEQRPDFEKRANRIRPLEQ